MRLPRERRIRASADFARLRHTGSRLDCGPFLLNYKRSEAAGPARFAVVAAKKSLPLAVDRNRAKRLARDCLGCRCRGYSRRNRRAARDRGRGR